MSLKTLNSVGGFSIGTIPITVIDSNADVLASNLSVSGNSTLGAPSNVKISGGTDGYFLKTDGAGNLSWAEAGGGSGNLFITSPMPFYIDSAETYYVTANHQGLFNVPIEIDGVLEVDGILVELANGGGTPGGTNTQVQFNNDGNFDGSSVFTFDTTTGTLSSTYFVGAGNALSNIQGANVSGAVGLATYATTANSVAGANVSGAVTYATTANSVAGANVSGAVAYATTANSVAGANVSGAVAFATTANSVAGSNVSGAVGLATYATTANSVAGANVSGAVAFASTANSVAGANVSGAVTYATTANSVAGANVSGAVAFATTANSVAGANVSGAVAFATTANAVAGANVSGQVGNALVAGTVYTNAQPNITSVGTLTTLGVNGNLNVTGNINVTGNLNYSNVTDLVVGDPLIYIGANNAGDLYDLGLIASYNTGTQTYTGIARNHNTDYWTFFDGITTAPEVTTVDWANATYPTVKMGNIISTSNITAAGNVSVTNGLLFPNASIVQSNPLDLSLTGDYQISVKPAGGTIQWTFTNTGALAVSSSNASFQANGTVNGDNVNSLGNITAAGKLSITGNANIGNIGTAGQVVSSIATGTAPFIVTSTTRVANLNVAFANIADSANSVAVANVSGIGNIAVINLNGNASQVLAGNGGWVDNAGNSAAPMPYYIPTGDSYTVPANFQGLFAEPIVIDGTFEVDGILYDASGGNVAGSNTQVQFNDAGSFGASSQFTMNTGTNTLAVPNVAVNGNVVPTVNGSYTLGTDAYRWAHVYTSDLSLSNEAKGPNEVDGTTGNWTIQEGADDLFLINNKNGKKYKFALIELPPN